VPSAHQGDPSEAGGKIKVGRVNRQGRHAGRQQAEVVVGRDVESRSEEGVHAAAGKRHDQPYVPVAMPRNSLYQRG